MHPGLLPGDSVSSCKNVVVGVSGKMQKGQPLGGPSFAVSAWGKDSDVSFNCSDISPHWIPCLLSDSPCLAGVLLLGKCGDPGTISTSELPVNLADGSVCPPNGLCKLWLSVQTNTFKCDLSLTKVFRARDTVSSSNALICICFSSVDHCTPDAGNLSLLERHLSQLSYEINASCSVGKRISARATSFTRIAVNRRHKSVNAY